MPPESNEAELARALLSRAEDERRRILEQARTEAKALLGEADAQVRALGEERLRLARQRARQEIAVRRSRVRVEHLGERERLLDDAVGRVLERAREHLDGVRKEPSYPALMSRLARACIEEFPNRAAIRLRVDPRDRAVVEALGLSARPEPSARAEGEPVASPGASVGVGPHELIVDSAGTLLGGVQATDDEGALLVDNTFEARLAARTRDVRLGLARVFDEQA